MMKRRLLPLALAAAIGLSASPAGAQGADLDRARTFFNAGTQAYTSARYKDAVNSFEQAYALAPRPNVLFALAQAERKQFFAESDPAMLTRALDHYKKYLDAVPSGGRRSEATEAKAELEARAARMAPDATAAPAPEAKKKKARVTVVSSTGGAQVSVDGAAPGEVPYFADVEPGRHKVRVFAEGYFDEEREVSGDQPVDIPLDVPLRERPALLSVALDRAGELYVDGRLVATTPLTRPVEVASGPHILSVAVNGKKAFSREVTLVRGKPYTLEPQLEASGQRALAWTMIVGGGAGLLLGGTSALVALGQERRARDIDEARATGNIDAGQVTAQNNALDRRDAWRGAAIVSSAVGAALVGGGIALFVFDRPSIAVVPPRTEPTPQPKRPETMEMATAPILGPGTLGWGLSGRF